MCLFACVYVCVFMYMPVCLVSGLHYCRSFINQILSLTELLHTSVKLNVTIMVGMY